MSAERDSLEIPPSTAYEMFWRKMLFDPLLREQDDAGILRLVEDQPKEPSA